MIRVRFAQALERVHDPVRPVLPRLGRSPQMLNKPQCLLISTPKPLIPSQVWKGLQVDLTGTETPQGNRKEDAGLERGCRLQPSGAQHVPLWEGEKGSADLICRTHPPMPPAFLIRRLPVKGPLPLSFSLVLLTHAGPDLPGLSSTGVSHTPSMLVRGCSHSSH